MTVEHHPLASNVPGLDSTHSVCEGLPNRMASLFKVVAVCSQWYLFRVVVRLSATWGRLCLAVGMPSLLSTGSGQPRPHPLTSIGQTPHFHWPDLASPTPHFCCPGWPAHQWMECSGCTSYRPSATSRPSTSTVRLHQIHCHAMTHSWLSFC